MSYPARAEGLVNSTSLGNYPQSNGRGELAVKTAKRILADSTDSHSYLYHNCTTRALLMHQNTPVQDLDMSPAMMLYGRIVKDHLPVLQDKYRIHKRWSEISQYREKMPKGIWETRGPTTNIVTSSGNTNWTISPNTKSNQAIPMSIEKKMVEWWKHLVIGSTTYPSKEATEWPSAITAFSRR